MPEPARPNTPTPSTQSFIPPATTVKSGPSIKELIHDPMLQSAPVVVPISVPPQSQAVNSALAEAAPTVPAPVQETSVQAVPVTEAPTEEGKPTSEESTEPVVMETTNNDRLSSVEEEVQEASLPRPPADPDKDPETFQRFWEIMVDTIFPDIPTLHEPLKHYHPVRKDNILIIPVKNEIQENAFAPRKHQVMAFLRQNWDETLDDIEVKLDLSMETKKYILDDNDKLNALREQNPDIADFIKTLNLRVKNY